MHTRYSKIILLVVIIFSFFFVIEAKAEKVDTGSVYEIKKIMAGSSNISDCGGSSGILGDVNDEESTAWLIQKLLNYLKILGPTIALILGSLDMGKAIVTSDDENMKKAQSRFIKRILAAVLLFFIPLFTQVLLGLFGITSDNATCGLK